MAYQPFAVAARATELVFDRQAILRGMHALGLENISDVMIVGEVPVDEGELQVLGVLVAITTEGHVGVTAHRMTEEVLRDYEARGTEAV